jgi:D-lactate dehydrogenase (cytochrome)
MIPKPTRPSPTAIEAGRQALADLLGSDRVATGADDTAQHGRDESFHPPAPPDMVVWPRTVEEAAAIVRVAAAHRLPIVPFGAGTSLEGHVAALAGGVCIDMREMCAITALSIDDLDVVVQAGVTRQQLDARLRPEGVFFPVDPGAEATIGGMIATGASGTTTIRYGAMRQNVLALTIIDARGRIVKTGSRARKSSAGYDLTRLMIGSEGTLGLICDATLRLQPTPEATAAAVCNFPSVAAAVQCSVALGHNSIPLVRVELVDEIVIGAINRQFELALTPAPTLFLEFEGGSKREVEQQAQEAAAIAAEHGGGDFAWASDESERRRLWQARHGALPAIRALRPGSSSLSTDVCVPVSALAESVTVAQSDIAEHGIAGSIVGHVGDGNFHVTILLDPDAPAEIAAAEAFHARLIRRAIASGGTCTGEHGVGYGKVRFLVEEHGEAAVELMLAIKRAFDPDGIFNPGKTASGVVLDAAGRPA